MSREVHNFVVPGLAPSAEEMRTTETTTQMFLDLVHETAPQAGMAATLNGLLSAFFSTLVNNGRTPSEAADQMLSCGKQMVALHSRGKPRALNGAPDPERDRAAAYLRRLWGCDGYLALGVYKNGDECQAMSCAVDETLTHQLERLSEAVVQRIRAGDFNAALGEAS